MVVHAKPTPRAEPLQPDRFGARLDGVHAGDVQRPRDPLRKRHSQELEDARAPGTPAVWIGVPGGAARSAAVPASASAHGIVGRADLPIPAWLFAWTATGVMVISFIALWSLWSKPRLQRPPGRVLCGSRGRSNGCAASSAWRCSRSSSTRGSPANRTSPRTSPPPSSTWSSGSASRSRAHSSGISSGRSTRGARWDGRRAGCRTGSATGAGRCRGSYPASWLGVGRQRRLLAFAWLELVYPSKDDPLCSRS